MEYSVVIDPERIDEELKGLSPFNLANDIKAIKKDFPQFKLERIAEEIANEIMIGPHNSTYVVLYICKSDKNINYSKIRTEDSERKKGKSNGYRAIVLIDHNNRYAILLHIYRHGHGPDSLSKKEKNIVEKLIEEYSKCVNSI